MPEAAGGTLPSSKSEKEVERAVTTGEESIAPELGSKAGEGMVFRGTITNIQI
jgi:hypothetical protein